MSVGPNRIWGHKEWTSRKSDPRYNMDWLRGIVGAPVPTSPKEEDEMDATQARQFNEMVGKVDWLFNELSRPYPNPMGHGDSNGVYKDPPSSTWLWSRLEAWRGKEAAEKTLARVGAMEGMLAALLAAHENGVQLTPEQITEAARIGAEKALDEKISDSRVVVEPR